MSSSNGTAFNCVPCAATCTTSAGVLQFRESTAETLQQISPQTCLTVNDYRDALKQPVRPKDAEFLELGCQAPELEEVLEGIPEHVRRVIREALCCTIYAAAQQQEEHMVHFSWAPAAGVVLRTQDFLPEQCVSLYRLAALTYVRRQVHELVSAEEKAPCSARTHGQELNNILTAAEKATSSILQGQGRGRDVAALQGATLRLRTALEGAEAQGNESTPGSIPPLLRKLPFQLRSATDLHMRGHACADSLLVNLQAKMEEMDLPMQVAASGYVIMALHKVAMHLERLDLACAEANLALTAASERFPGRGIEECLRPTPEPSTASDTPRQSLDLATPTDSRKRRSRKGRERKRSPTASPTLKLDFVTPPPPVVGERSRFATAPLRDEKEGTQVVEDGTDGPATPRKPDDDSRLDGTPRPLGARRLVAVSSDESEVMAPAPPSSAGPAEWCARPDGGTTPRPTGPGRGSSISGGSPALDPAAPVMPSCGASPAMGARAVGLSRPVLARWGFSQNEEVVSATEPPPMPADPYVRAQGEAKADADACDHLGSVLPEQGALAPAPPTLQLPVPSLPPVVTARAKGRRTDSSEEGSLERSSHGPTPLSFSSEEIHPDFHLLDDLHCPLKKALLVNPVVAADGWTYERSAIMSWLETHTESPMTHRTLAHTTLVPNLMARSMLQKLAMAQRRRNH